MAFARTLAVRLAITVAACFVGLALAEIAARIASGPPVPRPSTSGDLLGGSSEPGLRFANGAGRVQILGFRDAEGAVVREVVHTINSQGWRGREICSDKPPGVVRIACIGDSLAFGHGVDENDAWSAQLERELAADLGPRRVEALNRGVGGYDIEQKSILAQKQALEVACDIVLVQWFLNDDDFEGEQVTPRATKSWLAKHLQPGRSAWFDFARAHLRCVDLFAQHSQATMNARSFTSMYVPGMRRGSPTRKRVEEAFERLKEIERTGAAHVALVVFPLAFQEHGQFVSHRLDDQVMKVATAHGLEVIDLAPAMLEHGGDELRIHALDYHLNATGYSIAARETARFLRERGWLARSSEPCAHQAATSSAR